MMKRKSMWVLAFMSAMLTLAPATRGQEAASPDVVTQGSSAVIQTDVGRFLDRFLDRATVAAEAAGVITEADKYRQEADRMLKAGRRDEARALLRRAGETIAAAAPDRDAKRDDPFLREYLREVTAALVALEEQPVSSRPSTEVGGSVGDGAGASYLTNPSVAAFRDYWLGRGRGRLNIGRARLTTYRPMMARIFREEGVPEWLLAVAFVESTYNTSALSPKQALGIWQFIPETGARYGLQRTAWTDERQNPEKSTRAAARYLRNLYALFGDWPLAIAAYNTGENRVARIMRRTGIRDFWTMASRGLLYPETMNYVPSVIAAAQLLGPSRGAQIGREEGTLMTEKNSRATGLATPPVTKVSLAQATPSQLETDVATDERQGSDSGETESLEQVAERYNVPVSAIRQTVPGYYDIPSTSNGRRRGYVRIKKRQSSDIK